ncbi:Conserved_hypothetical protein [Hexamita inflata]|uniref:Uncharacterized protein n=1 Tax=Hexamita inflata TaxID=28002 RepID=A0AA86PV16_9EUKA|nr:Conserved hypothetical protein [Hexamita inflata]CAI9945336.1 Conserved hypothetical protein [Hexamita inflata]CAI9964047.1 Conserved hypothetical protein [Hexamita inflata]
MNQQQLDSRLKELSEKLQRSMNAGDYTAAGQIQNQIKELKASFRIDNSTDLNSEHEAYVKAINEAYADEEKSFNAQWERRLDEFNQNAASKMNELKKDLEDKLKQLDEKFIQRPIRFSSSVLTLRDQEVRLAKNQRFEEAKAVQREADQIEQKEIQEHQQMQQVSKEQQKLELFRFYEKQAKALMTKIEAGRSDILQKWASDMDKLDKHHEAMIKAEDVRFLKARQPREILDMSIKLDSNRLKAIKSPVAQYIQQQGAMVDGSQLGASMGPIVSKVQGLVKLK